MRPPAGSFRVLIDMGGPSATRGEQVEALVQAARLGSAERCRRAVLKAYRPRFPHVAVMVEPEPGLGARLSPGLSGAR